jgi:serine/threonine protein kinase/tetratricopeptide (TPR) repeat protein
MPNKCPKCHHENPEDTIYCGKCATPLKPSKDIGVTKTIETPVEEYPRGSTFADRYKIIEKLGIGGMGAVYRVEDTNIGQDIALKLIKSDIASDKKTIERFRNELKTTRMISHRNVCRMFDLAETEGTFYITMEYVSGEDLKSFIRRSGKLDIPKAISIAREVCEGLSEAHRLGVVHRDLKSNNIMIDKDGNARIMDFGIARSLRAKGLTGEGIIIGTPEYMSPEQAEAKEIDHRSDIYSLGIILYEMLTGQLPFAGNTPLSIAMKQKGEIPKDPKELNPQIPDELSHSILKCLEKDKEIRFQSAEEILGELIKIESGVTPVSGLYRPKTSLKAGKRKFSLGVIAVVFVLVLTFLGYFLLLKPSPSVAPDRVAVAAFENKTGNPALDQIGWMAADRITQGLAETGLLTVIPSSSVETITNQYQGGDFISFLADKTRAGTVVSGAYYLEGRNIEFHASITNTEKGEIIRALDPVSGPAEDPSKPVQALQQKLMGVLAARFDPQLEGTAGLMSDPPNYEAYQEYKEGMQYFMQREFDKAIEHFLRAAAYDPYFVSPTLFAVVAYTNLGQYAKADELSRKISPLRAKLVPGERHMLDWKLAQLRGDRIGAYKAIKQLLPLVPKNFTWYCLAGLSAIGVNYPQEAVEALEKLDPNKHAAKEWDYYWMVLTEAHHMLGNHEDELKAAQQGRKQYREFLSSLWYEVRALIALGRIEDVSKRLDESLTLPPQRGWNPGEVMSAAGQYLRVHGYKEASLQMLDRAVKWFESRPKEESETRIHRSSLARALYIAERWEEAQALYGALHEEFPDIVDYLGHLGTLAARMGDREKALRVFDQLEDIKRPYLFGNNTYWRARIAALQGEKENAMRLLRDALGQGVSYRRLDTDMDLEPLFDYPPFKELIEPKG